MAQMTEAFMTEAFRRTQQQPDGRRGRGPRSAAFLEAARADGMAEASLAKLFSRARETGVLSLANRALEAVPAPVFALEDHASEDERFWEHVDLVKLDLSHNLLSELDPHANLCRRHETLHTLLARNNRLGRLPPALFGCAALTTLDCSNNALEALPEDLASLGALTTLDLSENRLGALPGEIGALSALTSLALSGNRIATLPDGLGSCTRLRALALNGNELADVPSALARLARLETLELARNRIARAPALASLGAIVSLDLTRNALGPGPPALPVTTTLARLLLSHNRLERLDGAALLACAPSLAELHVASNKLAALPAELGACARLKLLDAANNELGDVPAELGYLPEANRIALDGNPLRRLRRSLVSAPVSELKAYLRTRGGPHPMLQSLGGAAVAEDDGLTDALRQASGGAKVPQLDGGALAVLVRDAIASGTLNLADHAEIKSQGMPCAPELLRRLHTLSVANCEARVKSRFGAPRYVASPPKPLPLPPCLGVARARSLSLSLPLSAYL